MDENETQTKQDKPGGIEGDGSAPTTSQGEKNRRAGELSPAGYGVTALFMGRTKRGGAEGIRGRIPPRGFFSRRFGSLAGALAITALAVIFRQQLNQ